MDNKLIVISTLALLAVFCYLPASEASCAIRGFYGTNCSQVCGFCLDSNGNDVECDSTTGECPDEFCREGWEGVRCKTAICELACPSDHPCIAPNVCDCGEDINLIQPNCENIRIRGLLGSGIAVLVLSFSVLFCSYGSKAYRKRHPEE